MPLDNPADRRRALLNLLDLVQAAAAADGTGGDFVIEVDLLHELLRDLEAAHPEVIPPAAFVLPQESAEDARLIEFSEMGPTQN